MSGDGYEGGWVIDCLEAALSGNVDICTVHAASSDALKEVEDSRSIPAKSDIILTRE